MDSAHTEDKAGAELAEYVPPRFPCAKCGKETKETVETGFRICSAEPCRYLNFLVTPEQVQGLLQRVDDLRCRVERSEAVLRKVGLEVGLETEVPTAIDVTAATPDQVRGLLGAIQSLVTHAEYAEDAVRKVRGNGPGG
jgi:hypothetical protein